ncbi:MAG: alpha/beta fold hydrolase [Opitutaceae bacterium]|jgi:haloalkane dehalogenase|nr:alpha/beta fold hydrolase [Opitutaceae bacterium]
MTAVPDWLQPLYPFTPKSFQTPGGARMSYLDEGGAGQGSDGARPTEAVLMLHGNPTWSFYYRDLVRALAPKLRCIVPDHIGMGLSDKPESYAYTLAQRIEDVSALVESLGLTRIHLAVHDWGGAIGFGVAARHAAKIGRIVILNTAAFPSRNIPRRIALCKTGFPGTALVRGLNGFAGPAVWMSMHRRTLSVEERRGFLHPYGSWADRVAVDAFVKDIPMDPSHPTWATLQGVADGVERFQANPVLIVWGGRDFCFDDTFYKEWRERLPDSDALYLADAGHYVLEDARYEVVPRLAKFFRV